MKLSHEEKLWLDILDFVDEHTESMTVARFDKTDVYNIATRLRETFNESATEVALDKILHKCKEGKLADNELNYLSGVLITTLKENSKNKEKWPPALIKQL